MHALGIASSLTFGTKWWLEGYHVVLHYFTNQRTALNQAVSNQCMIFLNNKGKI